MEIIFAVASWYKGVFDRLFAMIGFQADTPEGIMILLGFSIASFYAGDYFERLAERLDD